MWSEMCPLAMGHALKPPPKWGTKPVTITLMAVAWPVIMLPAMTMLWRRQRLRRQAAEWKVDMVSIALRATAVVYEG